LEKDHL
jgi:hypothetical protein